MAWPKMRSHSILSDTGNCAPFYAASFRSKWPAPRFNKPHGAMRNGSSLGFAKRQAFNGSRDSATMQHCNLLSSIGLVAWLWFSRISRSRSLRLVLTLNGKQFQFKEERRVWTNLRAAARFPVGHFGGNKDLPFGAHGHELESFRPAFDDFVYMKCRGLAALIRTVKLAAADERATVVTDDGIARSGLCSRAFGQNLELKAAG